MEPHVGQRIAAPFLSVPAEVKAFEPRAGYYRLDITTHPRFASWIYRHSHHCARANGPVEAFHRSLLKETAISESFAEASDMTILRRIASHT